MKAFGLFISLSSIALFSSVYAQTDPCSTLADLQSKTQKELYVGYGTGNTQKEADQNAQVDLARNIRQKVTATATVEETNENASLNATSKSVVSEVIIGAKTLKRCNNKDSFSAVVTLEKASFLNSLQEKLASINKKAKSLVQSLENAKDDETLAKNVDAAKKFLAEYQNTYEEDLNLCKTNSGCGNISKDEDIFSKLSELVAKEGDKDQYVFISNKDKVSLALRDDLISLLEEDKNEKIKIMDGAVSEGTESKRRILSSCKAKVGPKIPKTEDRVVETRCVIEAYIGKQKKFRKVYSCKSTMDSEISIEDAVTSCSGRLTLE
ncbi:hypothetical protein ACWNT8_07205 [Pigmentibacter ruber]|uniref:hypothetical protein n=1 Tax=Pigmentibacter ruber TaxID=2683196 RepID=UPI00131D2A57|nr:hypothetical protein [Pigmentibacter ruber]BFD32945.1 hypothetical protein GTC16762_25630 [Pigmentibacter ruber]